MPSELHAKTLRLLEEVPPFEADAKQFQSTLDPIVREIELFDATLAELRDNYWPQLADAYLKIWENLLGLAVESPELSLAQRRNAVIAFLQGIRGQSAGSAWEATLTRLIGTGWTYEEHDPDDPGSPPENSLLITIPYSTAIAEPSLTSAARVVQARNLVRNPSGETTPSITSHSLSTSGDPAASVVDTVAWAKAGTHASRYTVTRDDGARVVARTAIGTAGIAVVPGNYYAIRVSTKIQSITGGGSLDAASGAAVYWYTSSGGASVDALDERNVAMAQGGEYDLYLIAQAPTDAAFAAVGVLYDIPTGADKTLVADIDALMLVDLGASFAGPTEQATVASDVPNYFDGDSANAAWEGTTHNSISVLYATGTLAAGTYYYVVTAINTYGETRISNRLSVTTGSNSQVALDWSDVAGATGYRVYRGTVSGAEKRIAQVTPSAYTDAGAANGTISWPTANTTASPQAYQAEALARDITPAHIDLIFGYGVGFIVGVSQVGEEPL